MKRLLAILLLAATPALAADNGAVTVLRGTPAPPQPWYEPPPPPVVVDRQTTVIYLPDYSSSYWPPLIVNQVPLRHGRGTASAPPVPNGWPLLGRNR
jgi:hypothetical protein